MNRRWGLVLGVVVVALYLASMNDRWAALRDSALYLGLGQSLAAGHGMEFNGQQWLGIPPGLPAVIAASDTIFGPQYWPLNLFERLCGLGVILVAYLLVRRLAQDLPESLRPGIVAGTTLAVAFSEQLFGTSTRILTDVPFSLLLILGLYGCLRGRGHWAWYLLGAGVLGAACLLRIVGPVLVVGVALAVVAEVIARRSWRPLLGLLGIAALGGGLFLAWAFLVRAHLDPGTLDYFQIAPRRISLLDPHRWFEFGVALTRVPEALCACIVDQKLKVLHFNLVPTVVALVGLGVAAWRRQFLVVFPTVMYVGALAWTAPTAVASRYFLPLMPLFVYFLLLGARAMALGLARLTGAAAEAMPRSAFAVAAVWTAACLCVAISVPKMARELYIMHHPQFYEVYDGGAWAGYVEVSQYLRTSAHAPTDEVLTPRFPVVHYLSGLPVAGGSETPALDLRRLSRNKPRTIVEAALSGRYQYVIVPMADAIDEASLSDETRPSKEAARQWVEAVCGPLDASPEFLHPPREFHDLLLYQRAPQGSLPLRRYAAGQRPAALLRQIIALPDPKGWVKELRFPDPGRTFFGRGLPWTDERAKRPQGE